MPYSPHFALCVYVHVSVPIPLPPQPLAVFKGKKGLNSLGIIDLKQGDRKSQWNSPFARAIDISIQAKIKSHTFHVLIQVFYSWESFQYCI